MSESQWKTNLYGVLLLLGLCGVAFWVVRWRMDVEQNRARHKDDLKERREVVRQLVEGAASEYRIEHGSGAGVEYVVDAKMSVETSSWQYHYVLKAEGGKADGVIAAIEVSCQLKPIDGTLGPVRVKVIGGSAVRQFVDAVEQGVQSHKWPVEIEQPAIDG